MSDRTLNEAQGTGSYARIADGVFDASDLPSPPLPKRGGERFGKPALCKSSSWTLFLLVVDMMELRIFLFSVIGMEKGLVM